MSKTIISIKRGYDRADFMREMQKADLRWHAVEGLQRHFVIDDVAPADFILRNHPAIEAVNDGDNEVKPCASQPLSIDVSLADAAWGIARIIRRRAPWPINGLVHPINTYFRCVRNGEGVDYYSLDTGIRFAHSEFGGRATKLYEYVPADSGGDSYGHGTMTAAASCGSTVGVARNAQIFSLKITTSESGASSSDAALTAAIGQLLNHYNGRAALNRPAVVNLSFEPVFGTTVSSAISDMIDAGIVVCIAAGNSGVLTNSGTHPTLYVDDIIATGGVGPAELPGYFGRDNGTISKSNYGPRIDITAPGHYQRAPSFTDDSTYYRDSGSTSGANAYTSGVVACLLQGKPRLTSRAQVQAVKAHLLNTATTGHVKTAFDITLPDRLLYLHPDLGSEVIPGL